MAVRGTPAEQRAGMARAHRSIVARRRLKLAFTYLAVGVVVALFLIPFLWMIVTSLKSPNDLTAHPLSWLPQGGYLQNYPNALTIIPYMQYLGNTLLICVPNVVGTLLSCSLAAYSLACVRWPGRNLSFGLVLSTMMLPYPVTIIPLYLVYRHLGWIDLASGYLPLTVPAFFGAPFFIFLLRQFFASIPVELSEAAKVDGASELRIYAQIMLPLSRPALATTALLTFLYTYTDFLNPLIYISNPDRFTLSLGLLGYFSQHGASWGPLTAAAAMFTIPTAVIFLLAQRTFIQGIATSGLKG
ncbi:MAG TPA: carbohydrate ABC transporter permease [Chloroflexota bacterium]|nr:carbohydrate ABC transporter permease [Chloroflexota bacterium]